MAIWSQIITHSLADTGLTLTAKQLDTLGKHDLNGREIKNIVKLAATKAKGLASKVTFQSLESETGI